MPRGSCNINKHSKYEYFEEITFCNIYLKALENGPSFTAS